MRENIRLKQPFQFSLGVKQVVAVLAAASLIMGVAFALGLGVGRKSSAAPAQPAGASRDALARLDEPLTAGKEEPAPELKAHQALTDSRSIDKTMPVPSVNVTRAAAPAPRAEERTAPEQEIVMPPAIAAPGPAPLPSTTATASSATNPTPATNPTTTTIPTTTASPTAHSTRTAVPRVAASSQPARPSTKQAKAPPASRSAALHSRPKTKGAYTIQIASAHRRADAERVAKRVAARRPRIVTADVPGKGRWYRVQIGAYDSRESARLALASMSGVHGIVTPAR